MKITREQHINALTQAKRSDITSIPSAELRNEFTSANLAFGEKEGFLTTEWIEHYEDQWTEIEISWTEKEIE